MKEVDVQENKIDDEFLKKLEDPSTDAKPENITSPIVEVEKPKTKKEKFNDTMKENQATPIKSEETIPKKEESKPVEKKTSEKKVKKGIKITGNIDSKNIEVDRKTGKVTFEESKSEKAKKAIDKNVEISDDLESRSLTENENIIYGSEDDKELEQARDELLNQTVSSYINENYDNDEEDVSKDKVEIVSAKNDIKTSKKLEKQIDKEVSREDKLKRSNIYGGDGKTSAFKIRKSRVAKIVGAINDKAPDTSEIDPIDISSKSDADKIYIYKNKVAPILNPCFSVVPLIISGVVITMSAFSWPNIRDICLIDEKNDDLDPSDDEYVYKKNRLFIEKRKKQLDLFYEHIVSVSGYDNKPSQEDFYGKIMKWPDFQQLFFAAYSATFQKSYDFVLSCPRCGLEQTRSINPKNLCFMLNKNINIDKFNYYLKVGAAVTVNDESSKAFDEFQKERLVEKSNSIYRTLKPLSDSAVVCTLKVPTVNEAIEYLEQIIDTFKDKPLEYISDDGTTISVDSSFGINAYPELRDLKKYLYIHSILAAIPEDESEDDEDGKIKVGYFEFSNKTEIIDTISKLSAVDYKELISDPNLNAMTSITGIRHQYDAKTCENKNCNQDMGLMAIEPETLFFTIAKQELPN